MSLMDRKRNLWGKTDRSSSSKQWHSLLCHLLDVSAATETIWQRVIPCSVGGSVAETLGVSDLAESGRLLAFWAALHDIGKASPGFQALDQHGKARLEKAGLGFRPGTCRRHRVLSAKILNDVFAAQPGSDADILRALAAAVAGHHGDFPSSVDLGRLTSWDTGDSGWQEVRQSLIDDLIVTLDISSPIPPSGDTMGSSRAEAADRSGT